MSMGKCSQYPEPARTMRKDKLNYFVDYIFDIGMHLPGRRDVCGKEVLVLQLHLTIPFRSQTPTGAAYENVIPQIVLSDTLPQSPN